MKLLPSQVVDRMYDNDPFSQWLGIRRLEDGAGQSRLEMTVREEMCNGFGIAHGGITYALGDSALAFAANAHGNLAVSINSTISYLQPVKVGDTLRTEVEELYCGRKNATYMVRIYNQDERLVATISGAVHRSSKAWE